ncbi:MAG TPA: alpha-L-fucosidase [Mobilitalea sp.]|nr:alpha-L-fucosidase [Mobilitalea sp.]
MNKVKPSRQQLEFLAWEYGVFFHFGIRTFYEEHRDWDMKPMTLEAFNPTELNCEQWLQTVVAAGAKYAILVTKHHDGFANWPSKYTEYSVANTPWKDGKGDVVKEFTDACRKYGVKVGLYYSPADFTLREETRTPKEYDDYFINQISELLTNYGKIDYLWFDGCGSHGVEYDKTRIIKAIRSLQPEILIFNLWDPDTRWVLNEDGIAPKECFNTTNVAENQVFEEDRFMPAECDTTIRDRWFYSDQNEDTLKSVSCLMKLYYESIGHGANLLLNLSPDRRGLIEDSDNKRMVEFKEEVQRRFEYPVYQLTEMSPASKYVITFDQELCINHAILEENLTVGEGILQYRLSAVRSNDQEKVVLYEGTSLGHKRICQFPDTSTKEIVLEILADNDGHKMSRISFYHVI